ALVRVDNGPVPGLVKALALDMGLDHAALTGDLAAPAPATLTGCRTCADVLEMLTERGRHLIAECLRLQSPDASLSAVLPGPSDTARQTLTFLWDTVWPRLQQCHQEIDHILAALAGKFVPPGPSGAPTRGTVDVLPTGRNFYSLDVRVIP